MGGGGNRFCHFIRCGTGRRRLVHELGPSPRVCCIRVVPDCGGDCVADRNWSRPPLTIQMETSSSTMLPDLQSCVLCEDVRCDVNGIQTLVDVINVIPDPGLPINCLR